jgi:hypothetical protein
MHQLGKQPVGGWGEWTSPITKKIASIQGMAEGIRTMKTARGMSLGDARELVRLATKATNSFLATAKDAAEDAFLISDQIISVRTAVSRQYAKAIKINITDAINRAAAPGGAGVVAGPIVTANVALMLDGIAGGYQQLEFFKDIRPAFIESMIPPWTMNTIVRIAELVMEIAEAVGAAFKNAFNFAKSASLGLLDFLKWGSIAGGLYILYDVLKPENK